jgi:hypothetical protein
MLRLLARASKAAAEHRASHTIVLEGGLFEAGHGISRRGMAHACWCRHRWW